MLTPKRRMRVVFPMSLGLFCASSFIAAQTAGGPLLDLAPYLPPPTPQGFAAEVSSRWIAGSALPGPLLLGVGVVGFFLVIEALIRLAWRGPNEHAALLAATVAAVLPGQLAFQHVAGGEAIPAALALGFGGLALATSPRPALAVAGLLLALFSALIHPLMIPFVAAGAPLLRSTGILRGGRFPLLLLAGLLVLSAGLLHLGGGASGASGEEMREIVGSSFPPARHHAALEGRRVEMGFEHFLAAPLLAWDASPRAILDTGFEALAGEWPLVQGAFAWLVLLGIGALLGGLPMAGWALGLGLLPALGAPFLVDLWVPGDAAVVMLSALPLLGWLGCLAGAARGPLLRSGMLGLSLGVVLIGFFTLQGALPRLQRRTAALALPSRPHAPGLIDPRLEPDPARLVLYAADVGRQDVDAALCRREALRRLEEGAPALRPGFLLDLARLPNPVDAVRSSEERRLLDRLGVLSDRLSASEFRLRRGPWQDVLDTVSRDLELLIPEILEYQEVVGDHPDVKTLIHRFKDSVRRVLGHCTRLGQMQRALPLLEAMVELSPEAGNWMLLLGIASYQEGLHDEAASSLEEALDRLHAGGFEAGLAHGYLGLACFALGSPRKALPELDAGWEILGRYVRPAEGRLQPSDVRYWYVVEVAYGRFLVKDALGDPGRERALGDLSGCVLRPLQFGLRRIPALVFGALAHLAAGDRTRARALLVEMLEIRPRDLVEKADGSLGRLDHPHYRRLGLRTLQGLLDPAADAALLRRVEEELASSAR